MLQLLASPGMTDQNLYGPRSLLRACGSHVVRECTCKITVQDNIKGPDCFTDCQHLTIKYNLYIALLKVQQPFHIGAEDGALGSVELQIVVFPVNVRGISNGELKPRLAI